MRRRLADRARRVLLVEPIVVHVVVLQRGLVELLVFVDLVVVQHVVFVELVIRQLVLELVFVGRRVVVEQLVPEQQQLQLGLRVLLGVAVLTPGRGAAPEGLRRAATVRARRPRSPAG
jgi:hypothetical protein